MKEQLLINAFMKFAAKAGAGEFIRDFVTHVDENGNPKQWTEHELDKAIDYLNNLTDTFSREHAIMMIETLMRKFSVSGNDVRIRESNEAFDTPHVQGLQ